MVIALEHVPPDTCHEQLMQPFTGRGEAPPELRKIAQALARKDRPKKKEPKSPTVSPAVQSAGPRDEVSTEPPSGGVSATPTLGV